MHTIILVFRSKSTFFTKKSGIFLLNIGMSKYIKQRQDTPIANTTRPTNSRYNHIIAVLQRNRHAMPVDEGGLQQKLTKISLLDEALDSSFSAQFDLTADTFIGIEIVNANTKLHLHTDTAYGRKSNLLINVGNNVAVINHSNNDVLETVDIQPDEYFLLDTSKPHGCENSSDYDMMFLTINWQKTYQQVLNSL